MAILIRNYSDGTAAFLNNKDNGKDLRLGGPATATAARPRFRVERMVKVPLGVVDTGGGVLSWQNDEGATIIIDRLEIYVTTISTGACTVDAGATAVSATTSSDTLIDGLDVHVAGLYDNVLNHGTDGLGAVTLASGKWLTISKASGAAAGLAGSAYIRYHLA